jgi:hypothetical protein
MAITMALLVKFEPKYGVDQDWGGDVVLAIGPL